MERKTEDEVGDDGGHMDITQHEETWSGFMSLVKWGTIGVAVVLILMALFLL